MSSIRLGRTRHSWWIAMAVGLLGAPGMARATFVGRLGPTYTIQEPDRRADLLATWTSKAREYEGKSRTAVSKFLDSLPPVKELSRVERSQRRFVDLVYTAEEDVTDASGRTILRSGSSFDYGRVAKLEGLILLLDGRDLQQVALLQRMWLAKVPVMPVLVAGSYTQLTKRFRRPFYYDYGGALARKLAVTRVPSLVGQDGRRLRIEEIKP